MGKNGSRRRSVRNSAARALTGLVLAGAILGVGHHASAAPDPVKASAASPRRSNKVYAGRLGWVSPGRARKAGYFEYEDRWLPSKFKRKLAGWRKKDARTKDWRDRYKAKSRHYKIETTLPRAVLEIDVKPFLDELYETYSDVFRRDFGLTGRGAHNKLIRIFHGYDEYALRAKGPGILTPRTNPGFILNGIELVVFYEATDPANFYNTVFHEGAHQFVAALLPGADLPLWLDEALATYFEGCRYSRVTGNIDVGHLPPGRLAKAQRALREVKLTDGDSLPERMFMNVPRERFHAVEYSLAWSFVYYLTHAEKGKYRRGFTKFLRAMNGAGKRPVSEVFRRATGRSLKDLQRGWRAYILGLELPRAPKWVRLRVEDDPDDVALQSEDLVWSIDGERMDNPDDFVQWLERRPANAPTEWIVVRRMKTGTPIGWRPKFIHATVSPAAAARISCLGTLSRHHTLID